MSVSLNIDARFLLKEDQYPDGFNFDAHGTTVGECLKQYLKTKPFLKRDFFNAWGQLEHNIDVVVNGQIVTSKQLEKEVRDGDRVKILYSQFQGC